MDYFTNGNNISNAYTIDVDNDDETISERYKIYNITDMS